MLLRIAGRGAIASEVSGCGRQPFPAAVDSIPLSERMKLRETAHCLKELATANALRCPPTGPTDSAGGTGMCSSRATRPRRGLGAHIIDYLK